MKLIARSLLATTLAVIVASYAQAQRPQPGQGGGGTNISLVLTNKDLQAELKITDDQKSKLKDVTAKQTDAAPRANADGGKDNAALFEIEGGLPGFADGTQLMFELKQLTQTGAGIKV